MERDVQRLDDDFAAALSVFQTTARAIVAKAPALREALAPTEALRAVAEVSLNVRREDARAFFAEHFVMREAGATAATAPAFFTGYYEPVVAGSLTPGPDFADPILARPPDLVSFAPGEGSPGFDPLLAGARRVGGALEPYPARAEIEAEGRAPIVWLRDAVEVFLIQVQGSARVILPDGRLMPLVYDGRNGRPYTSIGRLLIAAGEIPEVEMSLARLKAWLRAAGLKPGERGRELMRRNESYIFFRLEAGACSEQGPIGGAGVALTPLRSIAVDRTRWSYGLPFWIEADLPGGPLRRLMIAQDTGSAIVGEARFDLYFGSGDEAGRQAGAIRHKGRAFVLEPKAVAG
jgi:membrane-bound lytic murein transglycosylase A